MGAMAEHLSYFIESLFNKNAIPKSLSNPIITGFPIYGIGALLVIWLRGIAVIYHLPLILEFCIYGLALEILEMISGGIVRAGSGSYETCDGNKKCISSWDYSSSKWNLFGIVDLKHFLLFGIAGIAVSRVNPYVQNMVEKMFNPSC